jgi:carboxylesterase
VRKVGSDLEDPEARSSAPLLPRYPAARLRDMFALQRLAKGAVEQVRCPSLVVVAQHDHVIELEPALKLQHALSNARLVTLQRGFHLMPRDVDRARLASEVGGFFDGLPTEARNA